METLQTVFSNTRAKSFQNLCTSASRRFKLFCIKSRFFAWFAWFAVKIFVCQHAFAALHLPRTGFVSLLTAMKCRPLLPLLLLFSLLAKPAAWADGAAILWQVKLPGGGLGSSPAVAPDGTVYQGTFQGWFLAVSPEGKVKWRFKAGLEIKSSPAVADDGTIYFGCRDRDFYALTPQGRLKWKFATGAWVDSSPAIAADGTIYFGSWDTNFYALTPDGKLKWKFATGGIVESSPAVAADGTLYFGSHDKNFYALTPDGKLKWKFATGGEVVSSPAIGSDGAVYFISTDGNVYAINADGTERWRLHTGDYAGGSPVLDEAGNLWAAVNQVMVSISPAGRVRWQQGLPERPANSPAALAGGNVYYGFPWSRFGLLDSNGKHLWDLDAIDNISAAPNVTDQGVAYVCNPQMLLAISPGTNAAPPAKSSWPLWRANSRHTGRVEK
jgi:outer membrane protein assembly factor BamB